MAIQKTKNYDMFKFREDNREKILQSHVNALIKSIGKRNLLEYKPIDVNFEMEVIDGQHRLLAAKALDVEIYYNVRADLKKEDIILMNVAKAWGAQDYMNFYCKNGSEHYLKLKKFMGEQNLSLRAALNLFTGQSHEATREYRDGEFQFNEELVTPYMDICRKTIEYVKKMNGQCTYMESYKFWSAMMNLFKNPRFDLKKWESNLKRLVERFQPKANEKDYYAMMLYIHNWNNQNKIEE